MKITVDNEKFELSRIDIDETSEHHSPELQITLTVYEMADGSVGEKAVKTIVFSSFADTKTWLDENWQSLQLDECWNDLYLTRKLGRADDFLRVMFRMELIKPEDNDEPFNVHDTRNQPRLVSIQCNDDGSKQILTFGMASGVRALERKNVKKIWSILFQGKLNSYDVYKICEFGIAGE